MSETHILGLKNDHTDMDKVTDGWLNAVSNYLENMLQYTVLIGAGAFFSTDFNGTLIDDELALEMSPGVGLIGDTGEINIIPQTDVEIISIDDEEIGITASATNYIFKLRDPNPGGSTYIANTTGTAPDNSILVMTAVAGLTEFTSVNNNPTGRVNIYPIAGKVLVSVSDTVRDYLSAKLVSDSGPDGILIAEENQPGGGRRLRISTSAALVPYDDAATGIDAETVQEAIDALYALIGEGSGGGEQDSYLISGGAVSWVEDYTYRVEGAVYKIKGIEYESIAQEIELDPADPTDNRIDVIALDNTGTAVAITGTPAADPLEPDVDPDTQLKRAFKLVLAGSTADPDIIETVIYDEDNDWTATTNSGNVVKDSTNNPRTGTKCIEYTNAVTPNYVRLEAGSPIDPRDYENLILFVRSKGTFGTKVIRLLWREGNTNRSINLNIGHGQYGLDTTQVATYQQLTIPMSDFSIPGGDLVDRLYIIVGGTAGGPIGFYVDDVILQSQAVPPPPPENHTHDAGDTISGTFHPDRLPIASESALGAVQLSPDGGTTAGEVIQATDSRLSDTRIPEGAAGGVLSGTYPDPGFAVDMFTQAEFAAYDILVTAALALKEALANKGIAGGYMGIDGSLAAIITPASAASGTPAHGVDAYGGPGFYRYRRANGVVGTATATVLNDILGRIQFFGHSGAGFVGSRADFRAVCAENWDASNQGTFMEWWVTPLLSSTLTQVMRLTALGLRLGATGNPDASALMDLVSTARGMLIPRMSATEWANISSKVTGLFGYVTTRNRFEYYNGTATVPIGRAPVFVALTDGATIASDWSLGDIGTVTLGGNRTLSNPTNPYPGQKFEYIITQDATGSRTLAYDTKFRFSTTTPAPTLTTTLNKRDRIMFEYHSVDDKFDCISYNLGY